MSGDTVDSALLYTFSTIAQALGGAIALLAAFVLYRLQTIVAEMREDSRCFLDLQITKTREGWNALREHAVSGHFAAFVQVMNGELSDTDLKTIGVTQAAQVQRLRANVLRQAVLRRWLYVSLGMTAAVMATSVTVLALVDAVQAPACLHAAVMLGGPLLFTVCLAVYVKVILAALEGRSK